PLTAFYRHRMMADGRLSKCAECTRKDVAANRQANLERVREYDRSRSAEPHRMAMRARIAREWQAAFPDRARAVDAANNAVRDGRLKRPSACEGCGKEVRTEKHHPDYSKPLLVVWLCKPCHAIADKIR